jgi:23S rRNA G2069 N7-methylase RlmK/C1962 C5-methylase RlmI
VVWSFSLHFHFVFAGVVADGWLNLLRRQGKTLRFDWIVSNPPVHRGQKDDFSVVRALLAGGLGRLRKNGRLYVVAQSYIPLATIAESAAAAVDPSVKVRQARLLSNTVGCLGSKIFRC